MERGMKRRKIRRGWWRWNEEGREEFKTRLGRVEQGEGEIEEMWEEMVGRVGKVLKRVESIRRGNGKGGWWDEECRVIKGEVRGWLREWRKNRAKGEVYSRKKIRI